MKIIPWNMNCIIFKMNEIDKNLNRHKTLKTLVNRRFSGVGFGSEKARKKKMQKK